MFDGLAIRFSNVRAFLYGDLNDGHVTVSHLTNILTIGRSGHGITNEKNYKHRRPVKRALI